MVIVAVDAMGGDKAPFAEVYGSIKALDVRKDLKVIFTGNPISIKKEISKLSGNYGNRIEIIETKSVVSMTEPPTEVIKSKRDSSLAIAAKMVKEGHADALVTAGNTGASMVASKLSFGGIEGIERPALAAVFPTSKQKPVVVLDVGANVDCKPVHLVHFAIMGAGYSNGIFGVDNPKVGLVNIGEESSKGNELTKNVFKLLEKAPINFAGNVEGRDIISGDYDVVVCDGFIGNVILKFGESVGMMIFNYLKKEFTSNLKSKIGALLLKKSLKNFKKKLDYSEYGGAPFLGLNNICIVCHGSSNTSAIKNAILFAADYAEKDVNKIIKDKVSQFIEKSK